MIEIKEATDYTVGIKALRDVMAITEDVISCKATFSIEPNDEDTIVTVTLHLNDLAYTYIGQIHYSTISDMLNQSEYKSAVANLSQALCVALREEIYSRIFRKKVDKPKPI